MLLDDLNKYTKYSHRRIGVICDYCGLKFLQPVKKIRLSHKNSNKDCCYGCRNIKRREVGDLFGQYWTQEEIDKLVNLYPHCDSINDLKINRSIKSIEKKISTLGLHKVGVLQRKEDRKDIDHNFFSNINPVSSYYAGLLAGDGTVEGNNRIGLSMADKECVEQLLKDINHSGRPSISHKPGHKTQYRASIYSKKMVSDLKTYWNIIPCKSLILQPPPIGQYGPEIILSFIIGLIDSDGWTSIRKEKNRFEIGVCGTFELMAWVKKHLNMTTTISKTGSIWRVLRTDKPAILLYNKLKAIETPVKMFRKWRYNFSEDGQRLEDDIFTSIGTN